MEKRTLTEEEIRKLKRNNNIAAKAQWFLVIVLIVFFIYLNFRVEGLDGAKCLSDPCNYCMNKFDDVNCIKTFKGAGKINYDNFTFHIENAIN